MKKTYSFRICDGPTKPLIEQVFIEFFCSDSLFRGGKMDLLKEDEEFFRKLRRSAKTIFRQGWRNQLKDKLTIRRKKLVWKEEDSGYICNGSFCFSGRCHGCAREREKSGRWVTGEEEEEITINDPVWSPDLYWKR